MINNKNLTDRTSVTFQKQAFDVAKEYVDELKIEKELELLPEEARETVEMFESVIEKIITLNPGMTDEIDIIRGKLEIYKRGYLI